MALLQRVTKPLEPLECRAAERCFRIHLEPFAVCGPDIGRRVGLVADFASEHLRNEVTGCDMHRADDRQVAAAVGAEAVGAEAFV